MQTQALNSSRQVYAGFFVRLFAFLLDLIIVNLLLCAIRIPLFFVKLVTSASFFSERILFRFTAVDILYYLLTVFYFVFLTYRYGRTFGKRLMNIQVISISGEKLYLIDIFYRETIGRYLSSLFFIGYLMIGANGEKEGLHDILCDTRVVYFGKDGNVREHSFTEQKQDSYKPPTYTKSISIENKPAVRMIACDLDGTLLLDGAQQPNVELYPLLQKLKQKGIWFVPASGRTYSNLSRLFEPVITDTIFICENGGLVIYRDQVLYKKVFPKELADSMIQAILNMEDCELLVSGERTTYVKPKKESYLKHLTEVIGVHTTVVDSFEDLPEEIIKISIYREEGISKEIVEAFTGRFEHVTPTVSGLEWLDLIMDGMDKGMALRAVMQQFGIKREETAAFGDNYNDIEMLKEAGQSYAMENGVDAVKEICPNRCIRVEDSLRKILRDQESI